jgi:hypothetical protein
MAFLSATMQGARWARSQQQRINTSLGVIGSRDEKRLPMLDEPRLLGPLPSTRTWPFLLKVPLASKPYTGSLKF